MTVIKVNGVVYRYSDKHQFFTSDKGDWLSYKDLASAISDRKIEYVEPVKVIKCGGYLYRESYNGGLVVYKREDEIEWYKLDCNAHFLVKRILSGEAEIIEIYE